MHCITLQTQLLYECMFALAQGDGGDGGDGDDSASPSDSPVQNEEKTDSACLEPRDGTSQEPEEVVVSPSTSVRALLWIAMY